MDNSRAVSATIVGAIVGGIAGYLFFTEHGRELRRRMEPALEDFVQELGSFRSSMQKAVDVAGEGWKVFSDAVGEHAERPRFSSVSQSSPF